MQILCFRIVHAGYFDIQSKHPACIKQFWPAMEISKQEKNTIAQLIFHPATVLVCAALASLVFVVIVSQFLNLSFAGKLMLYFYDAPIGFAFVIYLFDRAEQWRSIRLLQAATALLVILVALARAVKAIPFYSGHALFITFMFLTVSSKLARWTALMVMIYVICIKLFILHDPTVWGGIILALLAFAVQRYL
jgi:hypothetical protein